MPGKHPVSSTTRRHLLSDFINSFGEAMVKKCSTCEKHNRVCKVHVRSGKCGECVRRGQRCNVRVTESEFKRLLVEKERLRAQIKESREAQASAFKAHEKALEELRVARAREDRLRQQMDLLDRRAEDAISVEERNIEEAESKESFDLSFPEEVPSGPSLSPATWGAFEGFPDEFWENPLAS
jgi:hypothetical protein